MSPDEAALLRAVLAAPAADLPRLVYADWLDDHGRPNHAEFIRVQCEAARHPTTPPALARRERELWDALAGDAAVTADWSLLGPDQYLLPTDPPPAGPPGVWCGVYRRGFVDEVRLPLLLFVVRAADLFARQPVTRVGAVDFRPVPSAVGRPTCRWSATVVRALGHPPGLAGDFPDAGRALAALSAACVAHGRAAAGL